MTSIYISHFIFGNRYGANTVPFIDIYKLPLALPLPSPPLKDLQQHP